ncbi:MAG: hypothetical protein CV087_04650 [Candidatus Brocadia sp. WS118]|nr:MAG: hypothetical protein CV087_04650 [Candidatus Brocadia sp. WS118]
MAKIPQYQQSTLPPGGEDFPGGSFAPIYFADEVGNSIRRAGNSLANLGNTLSDVSIRQQKAQEAIDISNALADLQTRMDEAYQKHKLEEQDPVLFESKFRESANAINEDVLGRQTKNAARGLQPYIKELSVKYQMRAKADAIGKQVDIGHAQRISSAELLSNTALEGYKRGDFEAGYDAIQKYDALLERQKHTGLIGLNDAAAESLRFRKQITRDGYLLAIQNDPEGVMQKLQDSPGPFLDPLTQSELIGTASKAIRQFNEAQQKVEKDAYTNFMETSVQDAFGGRLGIDVINSPDFKSNFKDPADYDKVVRALSQPKIVDPDRFNNLMFRINADPYSLSESDIVSAEGISVSDKTRALEELQRNQEIANRPNYKPARELFDVDFKQQFGDDLSVDPAEEKAKWLRVFHSYIIDKKMEPLDAAEKIKKDYGLQENPPPAPSQEGNVMEPTPEGDNRNPLQEGGGVGKSEAQNSKSETGNSKHETRNTKPNVDPTDSLFAGIGKSVVQGTTAFPRTFWGAGAMAEDIIKSVPQAIPLAAFTQIVPEDFFKRRYEDVKGIEERFQAKGEGYKKYINGAIRTMSEMLSQYAGTTGLGTLPSMSAGAGIDKYLGVRKEGYSIPRSFAAGGITTATEYVTEKTPLEILGRPGLKFVDRLMKGLVADIPGEVEATLVEMTTVDQAILGKTHTRQEYLGALLDTAATAALTTLGATGVVQPFVAGIRSDVQQTEQIKQTPEAPADQQTQQTPEIKQPAKEEVPGVKPEEYATAPQSQIGTQQTTPTKEVYKDYNDFLVKREEQGELAKTTKQQREQLITAYNEFPTGKEFITDLGEKISFALPEGKSKEEYIHHFLTKFSPDKKKEFYSGRYLELVREIPDTIKNYDERILGEINGQDRIYYTREFPGTSKTPHHVLVVSVDANGKFVGWTHFEAKENYKQKLLKTEKEVVSKRGLVDSKGNKADISYDEYEGKKRSALFYLGNNALSGLRQSQGSPSRLEKIIPPSSEIVKSESVKPVPATLTPEQFSLVSNMEEELAMGEAPQLLKKETDEAIEYKRTQSTNPQYFVKLHDYYKGISKAYVRNIFKKAKSNETLTPKQTEVLQSLLNAKTEAIESQKYYVREQLPKVTVGELDLNVGDKFKINGEEFLVSEIDKEGNYTIKDGIAYEVDVFDKIPQPDEGSIERVGAPTVMPVLQGLVDTGKLSLEDALEIDGVAKQNNWSEDTVKQFYKSAIGGVGIQNKDTASIEQMLVTAKVKEAVYKQNAEQYKQELAETEAQIERLYKLIKIEGGAPGKYETAASDFIRNLGDLKKLTPEEIILKAQEELALNLNRLDTGMDVKTLIAATVKTINEAEGISKEVVSHEQTVQEALKELPGIYSKVIGMKRGKTLTRPQQLAARMLGTSLFDAFNRTKLQGMANPTDQKLYQQAQAVFYEIDDDLHNY